MTHCSSAPQNKAASFFKPSMLAVLKSPILPKQCMLKVAGSCHGIGTLHCNISPGAMSIAYHQKANFDSWLDFHYPPPLPIGQQTLARDYSLFSTSFRVLVLGFGMRGRKCLFTFPVSKYTDLHPWCLCSVDRLSRIGGQWYVHWRWDWEDR